MDGNFALRQQTISVDFLRLAIQDFEDDRKSKSLAKRTVHVYVSEMNLFYVWLQSKGFNDLTTEDITVSMIRQYFLELSERRNKGGVHCSYRVVRAFFNWYWEENDLVSRNPIHKVKIPNPKIQPLPEMPLDDIQKLLDVTYGSTKIRDIALLKFLLDTGCRANECLSLNVGDIHFDENSVFIKFGKGSKSRTTYFGKNTRNALLDYLTTRESLQKDDPLFLNELGIRMKFQGLRHRVETLCRKAGVQYRGLHSFRRSFGITLYRQGVDIFTISRLLGHSQIEVTKRYLAVSNDDLKSVFVNSPADKLG